MVISGVFGVVGGGGGGGGDEGSEVEGACRIVLV